MGFYPTSVNKQEDPGFDKEMKAMMDGMVAKQPPPATRSCVKKSPRRRSPAA